MGYPHQPVLLPEALDGLALQADGVYIDATFGRGGHSRAILAQLSEQGRLIVIDRDQAAIETANQLADPRVQVWHGPFSQIQTCARELGCLGKVAGVLLDLGVSSPQLDEAARGFSFMRGGPLDMRMDQRQQLDAMTWLNEVEADELSYVLKTLGEERYARRIARAVVAQREVEPLATTSQLAELISQAVPMSKRQHHPATKSFQAIRMYINDELGELEGFLASCHSVLAVRGRLCVISFHSLEDRMVKQFIAKESRVDTLPKGVPIKACDIVATNRFKKIGKMVRATEQEIAENPRSRSAKLRIAEKVR